MNIVKRSRWLFVAAVLSGCRSSQTSPSMKTSNPSTPAAAAMPHPRLTVSLDHSFPEYGPDGTPIRANFQTLAQDVLQVVQSRFGGRNPSDTRPIVCYVSSAQNPNTNGTQDPAIIWIGITLRPDRLQKLDYSKFAYQLAHELGHVMLGTLRSNGLIETLADAISYQALTDLSELWRAKYPGWPAWSSWAYNFQNYRKIDEKEWLACFPEQVQTDVVQGRWNQVSLYLKQHVVELDEHPKVDGGIKGYALRSLGAIALLSQPVPWEDFTDLTHFTNPSPQQDGRDREDLPIDISRAPVSVQEAVRRFR